MNNKKCYISGKWVGIIYLGISIFCVALVVSYIRVDYLVKGMSYVLDTAKAFVVIALLMFLQFIRWFCYSFYTDNKTITIKKIGRSIEFEKTDVTSIYSVDFIGTIIKYNDTKVIIPTRKRTFYEKLGEAGIAFSDDVRFARMRDKGHVTVRPKWYALLFRFFWSVVFIIVGFGTILGIKNYSEEYDFLKVILSFVFLILAIYVIWLFNRSFVYINEECIWQGLLFPRVKYSWKEFDRAKLRKIHARGKYNMYIEILNLYFKDSKKKISISFEDYVLNTEDLLYLLELNGIPR